MARIDPVDPDQATEDVQRIWKGVETLLGRVPNFFRTLMHSPDVARWFLPFCATLHREGAGSVLELRIKNLVVLKTSETNACAYCVSHNRAFGEGLGLTEEQFEALRTDGYRTVPLFDERERAAIAWAEAVTRNTAKFDKEAWEQVRAHFSDAEIVEMTFLSGMFNLINRFNDSLFVDIEDEESVGRIRKTTHLPRSVVTDYARDMVAALDGA